MIRTIAWLFGLTLLGGCSGMSTSPEPARPEFVIAIHGGAGTLLRSEMSPEKDAAYRAALTSALEEGYRVLDAGGSAVDAVEATLRPLEDSPLFNAGVGAVFTADETIELDASIMDGRDRNAGGVAGVKTIRHPISLARLVMEKSPHVMMAGSGAERFADQFPIERVENRFFETDFRREQLERARERSAAVPSDSKFGTVGAVALDRNGNLAAGTSTGGMTNKEFGRIGDSPVIGAGTWADNATCAVSSTGHGEFFIRCAVAHDIAARMRDRRVSLADAARQVIDEEVGRLGGTGGVIALDQQGNVAAPFNTDGMYRGWRRAGESATVKIYRDEP